MVGGQGAPGAACGLVCTAIRPQGTAAAYHLAPTASQPPRRPVRPAAPQPRRSSAVQPRLPRFPPLPPAPCPSLLPFHPRLPRGGDRRVGSHPRGAGAVVPAHAPGVAVRVLGLGGRHAAGRQGKAAPRRTGAAAAAGVGRGRARGLHAPPCQIPTAVPAISPSSRPSPLLPLQPAQFYPAYAAMFQRLDSVIKRADAVRYFIMHAMGGAWRLEGVGVAAAVGQQRRWW